MSDDNSSEVNVNVYDKNGYVNEPRTENKKSSETDYYFSHIANHNKTVPVDRKKDSSDEEYENESERSNNSSRSREASVNNSEVNNRHSESRYNTHSESRRSETKSEHEQKVEIKQGQKQGLRLEKKLKNQKYCH